MTSKSPRSTNPDISVSSQKKPMPTKATKATAAEKIAPTRRILSNENIDLVCDPEFQNMADAIDDADQAEEALKDIAGKVASLEALEGCGAYAFHEAQMRDLLVRERKRLDAAKRLFRAAHDLSELAGETLNASRAQ